MMIPRGLAAAVLATMISQSQLPGSERVGNIVFSVIFFTIIFTSVLVPLLEKSVRFRIFYIRLIHFPSFGKKILLSYDEETTTTEINEDKQHSNEEEKVIIHDDDDIPNILL